MQTITIATAVPVAPVRTPSGAARPAAPDGAHHFQRALDSAAASQDEAPEVGQKDPKARPAPRALKAQDARPGAAPRAAAIDVASAPRETDNADVSAGDAATDTKNAGRPIATKGTPKPTEPTAAPDSSSTTTAEQAGPVVVIDTPLTVQPVLALAPNVPVSESGVDALPASTAPIPVSGASAEPTSTAPTSTTPTSSALPGASAVASGTIPRATAAQANADVAKPEVTPPVRTAKERAEEDSDAIRADAAANGIPQLDVSSAGVTTKSEVTTADAVKADPLKPADPRPMNAQPKTDVAPADVAVQVEVAPIVVANAGVTPAEVAKMPEPSAPPSRAGGAKRGIVAGSGAADVRTAAGARLAAALAAVGRADGSSGAVARPGATAGTTGRPPGGSATGKAQSDAAGDSSSADPLPATLDASALMPAPAAAAESAAAASARHESATGAAVAQFDAKMAEPHLAEARPSGLPSAPSGPSGVSAGAGSASLASLHAAVGASRAGIEPAVEADLPRQIVQAVRLQWQNGVGDAHINLQPDYLGDVSVAIRVEHGAVTASIGASTPAVRQWMETHEPLLRQALADQGLRLDRLVVMDEKESAAPQRERQDDERGQSRSQPQRRRRPVQQGTFEVVV